MLGATLLFFPIVHAIQWRTMRADPTPTELADVLRGLDFLWGRQGTLRRVFGPYLGYFRRDFHPWQHDNTDLSERWETTDRSYVRS